MKSYLLEHETAVRVSLPGAITLKPWIDAQELHRSLDTEGAPAIVDVRGLVEFFSGPLGRLPAAINVPLPQLPDCIKELGHLRSVRIVLVSKTQTRAERAAMQLRAAGFANVSVLRGGMEQWNSLGYPRLSAPVSRRVL
jgi:rhodanese-related sulfurtransferase